MNQEINNFIGAVLAVVIATLAVNRNLPTPSVVRLPYNRKKW